MTTRTLRHRAQSALLSATLAASVLVPLTAAPAAAQAQASNGSIDGVLEDANGIGLAAMCVGIFDLDGNRAPAAAVGQTEPVTGSDGSFFVSGLTQGSYKLRFRDCGSQRVVTDGGDLATMWYGNSTSHQNATAVAITAADAQSSDSAQFGADKTASMVMTRFDSDFAGEVRDGVDNSLLPGTCIQAYEVSTGALVMETATRAGNTTDQGKYNFYGLPDGSYHVLFRDDVTNCGSLDRPAGSHHNPDDSKRRTRNEAVASDLHTHVNEYWDDKPTAATATVLQLPVDGGAGGPINAVLAKISQSQGISGTVRDDAGNPVGGICVTAYDKGTPADPGLSTTTNLNGGYQLALTTGRDYFVEVHERCNGAAGPADDLYVAEFVNGPAYADDDAPTSSNPTLASFTTQPPASAAVRIALNTFTNVEPRIGKRGSIAGLVTDQSSPAQKLGGVCVMALDGPGATLKTVPHNVTASDGTYTITGLRPGPYVVRFAPVDTADDVNSSTDEHCAGTQNVNGYLGEYYSAANSRSGATVVTVGNGQAVTGRNASLRSATTTRTISGRVTTQTNVGHAGLCVRVLDLDGDAGGRTTTTLADDPTTPNTDESGNYTVAGVPPGQYKVEFSRPDNCGGGPTAPGDANYIATEFYNDATRLQAAQTLTVGTANLTGINAQVGPGARLAGQVTEHVSPTSTQPLPAGESACVELLQTNGAVERSAITTSGYAFEALRPATYLVRFDDRDPGGTCDGKAFADSDDRYATEWFDNKFSQADATPVTLQGGTNRANVNAALNSLLSTTTQFTKVSGYVENGSGNGIDGVLVEFFRFNQDPAVDKPVFTATTGRRQMIVAQRQCQPGGSLRPYQCPTSGEADQSFVAAHDITRSGYWEVSSATQPANTILAAGSYKVRFRDPTGLHATEWYRGQSTFATASSVVLDNTPARSVVEIGEKNQDNDRWDLDTTDDEDDDPFDFLEDSGDAMDYDTHTACHWNPATKDRANPAGCPFDGFFPPNASNTETVTDLALAGTVDGRTTNASTGQPVKDVRVDLLGEETGNVVASGFSKADGTYRILGVAPGGYKVRFTPADPTLKGEFFDKQTTFGTATVIAVGASRTRSAVNAALKQNTAPKPGDDKRQALINKANRFADLLSNDVDPEGDPIRITAVGTPTHGTAVLEKDGSITFTPGKDRKDNATFTYTVSDVQGLTGTATVTVEMVGRIVGAPPAARDDEASTGAGQAVFIDVLANDTDPDGTAPLQLTGVGTPFHGTAAIVSGKVRYQPDNGFTGLDQFIYEVTDSQGFTSNAKVTVAVESSGVDNTSRNVDANGTVATGGTQATDGNPMITSVTTPNKGQVTIKEEKISPRKVGDITLANWQAVITAPNATVDKPLTIQFRLDGVLLQGAQAPRAIRVLRNNALVADCLGSTVAKPDPCVSGRRQLSGDDILLTIRTSKASTWNFGFDNDAVVTRASGTSRVATAVAVSRSSFDPADVDTVLLARADAYPDALAGAPLAHKLGAPILLTSRTSLDQATRDEIGRLGAKRVVILGGTGAVSANVENQVRALSGVKTVDRIAGSDRYATAAAIAKQLGTYDTAYVVEGFDPNASRGWPDAVAVASLAAFEGRPILLVTTEQLPTATRNALSGLRQAIIVGGPVSVSDAVARQMDAVVGTVGRIRGKDRYETSYQVAQRAITAGMSPSSVWIATGQNFPDALAAGPAVAREGGILLLVNGKDYTASPSVDRFLTQNRGNIETVTIAGGTSAVSLGAEVRIGQATQN